MDSNENKNATLFGGVDLTVALQNGGTETVKVRQLTIRFYQKLLEKIDDEAAQLELYCDKPQGWADTLTPASFKEAIAKADEINADFFIPWVKRRLARQELAMPGFAEKLSKAVVTSAVSSPPAPSPLGSPGRRSLTTHSPG